MDTTDQHQHLRAAPELTVPADQERVAPARTSEPEGADLPAWLTTEPAPAPVGRWRRPAYAWGGTLAATALMVSFGLWLHEEPVPVPQQLAAIPAAPTTQPLADPSQQRAAQNAQQNQLAAAPAPLAPTPAAAAAPGSTAPAGSVDPVPPLVLLPAAAAAESPEPARVQAAPVIAKAAPVIVKAAPVKPRVLARAATLRKSASAKRRSVTVAARSPARPSAGALSDGWSSKRVSALEPGSAPRMRCKRGELARECLARYQ